jgi:iron complex outermembrane receptor protein
MVKSSFLGATALRSAVAFGALATSFAPAFAQDAPPAQQEPEAPTTAAAPTEDGPIVVTGSRLRRSEFNSPDPITIIDPEIAQAQGLFSTGEMIQSSTVASGSNQITSAISTVSGVTNGGPGSETISLRGLGAERTLVLLNGRRAGPAGTRGGVSSFDLNVLPQSIVKSVEILKTGASSVYGSDAIAGVVNLITKTDTDGLELTGFSSVPQKGGGEQYRLAGAWGKDFEGGHLLIAFDYFKRNELKGRDRSYLDCPEEYIFRPNSSTRADPVDPRTGSYRCATFSWGHNWVYDSGFGQEGRWQFSYGNDNLGAYLPSNAGQSPGFGTPAGFYQVGYDQNSARVDNLYHPFIAASTVIPETSRYTAYIDGGIDITDSIKFGTELLFNRRETRSVGAAQFYYFTGYTSDQNGAAPGRFGNPLHVGWTGPYYVSPTPITDHAGGRQKVDYYRGLAFLEGDFGKGDGLLGDWNWNIWGQYSRSEGTYWSDVIYTDAINTANLQTSSCVGTVTPVSGRRCIDINWLDPQFLYGNLTKAQRDFLYGEDKGTTIYEQIIGEASLSGSLVDLPAGKVQMAIGATWRRDEIVDTPGEAQQADNNFIGSAAGITAGYVVTKEAFGEIEVPLFKDMPGMQSFTLSGSARLTNVKMVQNPLSGNGRDEDNGNWTYSVGANWEVTDWMRLRGRYGTSFRAPALFELFLGDQVSGGRNRDIDPCVNYVTRLAQGLIQPFLADRCRTGGGGLIGIPNDVNPVTPGVQQYTGGGIQPTITTGGGVGVLDPETSTAKTFGVVLTPKFGFLPDTRLNLAVDYFNINIKGEIATLSAAQVVGGCYASQNFPAEPLCGFFERYPVGTASQYNLRNVNVRFININEQVNEGIDVTFSAIQDLGKLGKLTFLSQMTWQLKDTTAVFGGFTEDDNGESGDPVWTGKFNFIWAPDDKLSIFYGLDVIGQTNDEQDYIDLTGSLCTTGSAIYGDYCVELIGEKKFYHSISASYKVNKDFQLTLGMTNFTNTKPPRTTITGGNTLNAGAVSTYGQSVFTSQYDLLGRRVFINATAKF